MNQEAVRKLLTFLLIANSIGAARAADNGAAQAADNGSARHPGVPQQAGTYQVEPSGPFGLSYEILGTPELGQPLEVRVEVVPPLPLSYMSVEVYAYDGLIVSPLSFSVTAPSAGEPVEQTLIVTPWMEGSLRLALLVLGDDLYGETQAGQLTVPIQLGELRPDTAAPERLRTTAEGETIISLPAREN